MTETVVIPLGPGVQKRVRADSEEAAQYRRSLKPRADKGCKACHTLPTFAPRITRVEGLPRIAFNASLVRYQDRLLLAYRNSLCGSNIFVVPLGGDLQPAASSKLLRLEHPHCGSGREDPRLFVFRDRLHVSFNGVELRDKNVVVHVLVALLRDDLTVERTWEPRYELRRTWEKSWGFFEHDGELLAVYEPAPRHLILHHTGDAVEGVAVTGWNPRWTGGTLRGGAPPVRVGNEYWCFAHGSQSMPGRYDYVMGLYTFDAAPPFRPRRICPVPLLTTDRPGTENANRAVYPCGAVRDGDRWLVSYGLSDTFVEVAEFTHAELEKGLVPA